MTYGWSILIIAIVLVSLFELGVFGNNSLSGNGSCISQSGYLCTKVTLATNGILSATIGSAYGAITLTGIACTNNSAQPTSFNTITSTQINNGETIPISFLCPLTNNALGSSFNGNLWIEYTSGAISDQITKVGAVSLKATILGTSSSGSGSGTQQIYYAPITLSNDQSNSVPADFQQMIYFNPTSYSSNEMVNLSNIEFTASAPIGTSGNVPLYSWIESNAFSTSTNTVIWVNLGSNTMGAAGSGSNTLTIYMNFLNSNTPVTSGYAGYAPQLWCASGCFQTGYAQYDNGANVFPFYDNFAGTTLPNGWSTSDASGATVNNGLSITAGSVYTNTAVFSSLNTEEEMYAEYTSLNNGGYSGIMQSNSQSVADSNGNSNVVILWMTAYGSNEYYAFSSNGQSTGFNIQNGVPSGFTPSLNTFYVIGTFIDSNNVGEQINYVNMLLASGTYNTNQYIILGDFDGSLSTSTSVNPITIDWIRTRAYPPNGVMPDVNLGGVV